MKSILKVLVPFIIMITFQSCNYLEGLYLDGEYVETEIWIDELCAIKIETPAQLILEQTSEEIATVSGLDFKVQKLKIVLKITSLS